jgi:isopropylmalate/homocitrate/citramalate synthase
MSLHHTLQQIERLRNAGRAERVAKAQQFTEDLRELAHAVKNGLVWEDFSDEMQDFLLSCSEAVFQSWEKAVQFAPTVKRGGAHTFTQRRTEPVEY